MSPPEPKLCSYIANGGCELLRRNVEVRCEPQIPKRSDPLCRFLVKIVRLVCCEFRLAGELTINDNVDIVAELIGLSVTRDFKPARMWDRLERRQTVDHFVDVGLVFGGK